jgi:chromosomal replication initiator protein
MGTQQPDDEANALWHRAGPILRQMLGDSLYRAWIAPIRAVSANATMIVLACTSQYHRDTVIERFGERITDLLASLSKVERDVEFVVGPDVRLVALRPADGWEGDATLPDPSLVEGSVRLDRSLTFKNFVTAPSNETAFHVAEGLANGTEICANPLFIFGSTGLGKTHLMQSIVWRLLERDPGLRVLYLTAEGFLQLFLSSLRAHDTQAFKDLVRNVDVLVCDDLQFLAGKTATAEEFFFTFDDLVARGKTVILSADGSPSLMEHLPGRLRSRLVNGGGVEISPAGLDLRLGILRAMARRRAYEAPGFVVGDDVLRMIAGRLHGDGRALGGALNRLVTRWRAGGEDVTFEKAVVVLNDFLRAHNRRVTLNEIKAQVAAYYKIKVSELESTCRRREFVRPRQVGMYLSRVLTQRSYPEIGRSYRRDHTTIIHGFERIRARCESDPALAADIEAIKRLFRD